MLFSALEKTHSAVVQVTVAFHGAFLNVHRSAILTALFGCYMAGAR